MDEETTQNESIDREWVAVSPSAAEIADDIKVWVQRSALVLEARGLLCRVDHTEEVWQLLVPAEELGVTEEELRLFQEENRNWPPVAPPVPPVRDNSLTTFSVLILLATFHNLTLLEFSLPGHDTINWIALGSADAAKILNGEWWRLVTALTLHLDWLHLLSNVGIGGIFVLFLSRDLGSGLAWCLLLGSGVLGNMVNAYAHAYNHSSVGFSTAVFGAVGILAALTLVSYREGLSRRWLRPVAAALALLALLGTEGKHTDLGAHLFGFVYGMAVGLIAGYWVGRYGPPGRWGNRLLGALPILSVLAAWWIAIGAR